MTLWSVTLSPTDSIWPFDPALQAVAAYYPHHFSCYMAATLCGLAGRTSYVPEVAYYPAHPLLLCSSLQVTVYSGTASCTIIQDSLPAYPPAGLQQPTGNSLQRRSLLRIVLCGSLLPCLPPYCYAVAQGQRLIVTLPYLQWYHATIFYSHCLSSEQ